jgi:hypothetical protein
LIRRFLVQESFTIGKMNFFEGYTLLSEEMSADGVMLTISGQNERLPVSKIVLNRHIESGSLLEL